MQAEIVAGRVEPRDVIDGDPEVVVCGEHRQTQNNQGARPINSARTPLFWRV